MRFLKLLLMVSFVLSCKPRNLSDVKHEFGQTQRNVENFSFENCELSYESKKIYPITQAHLQKIAMAIMTSNPQTFKPGSKLDPKLFCINVKHDLDFNAYARAYNRSVTFHTSAFAFLGTDASIAAVMAHELAHITMLHKHEAHPKFVPSSQAKQTINESVRVLKTLNSKGNEAAQLRNVALAELEKVANGDAAFRLQIEFIELFDENFHVISGTAGSIDMRAFSQLRNAFLSKLDAEIRAVVAQKIDRIATLLVDSAKLAEQYSRLQSNLSSQLVKNTAIGIAEGMNWEEQEADEVGLEFYRRAGFQDSYFFDMLYQLATIAGVHPNDLAKCMQMSFKAILLGNNEFEPARGGNTHPESCWRIFDHQKELLLHKNDYQSFPNDKVMLSVSGLADAVDEITSVEKKIKSGEIQPGNVTPLENPSDSYPLPGSYEPTATSP